MMNRIDTLEDSVIELTKTVNNVNHMVTNLSRCITTNAITGSLYLVHNNIRFDDEIIDKIVVEIEKNLLIKISKCSVFKSIIDEIKVDFYFQLDNGIILKEVKDQLSNIITGVFNSKHQAESTMLYVGCWKIYNVDWLIEYEESLVDKQKYKLFEKLYD